MAAVGRLHSEGGALLLVAIAGLYRKRGDRLAARACLLEALGIREVTLTLECPDGESLRRAIDRLDRTDATHRTEEAAAARARGLES